MPVNQSIVDKFDLTGKTAVVTGGSKGIGKNLTKALSEAGATVLIAARNVDDMKATADEISSASGNPVKYTQVDLTDRASVMKFVAAAEEILGHVDILVANASYDLNQPIHEVQDDTMDATIEVNYVTAVLMTREFSKKMKERGWGRLIYISSATAFASAADGHSVYSGTKVALHAFARTVAIELGGHGITANVIAAGTYLTENAEEHLNEYPPEVKEAAIGMWADMNAVGRWGDPEDMEGALLLLASDASSFITGSVMVVDGGLSIRLIPNYLQ